MITKQKKPYPLGYKVIVTSDEEHHDTQRKYKCIVKWIEDGIYYVNDETKTIVDWENNKNNLI